MATKMLYAWYSETQKKHIKSSNKLNIKKTNYTSHIYLNSAGNEVEVTEVSSKSEYTSKFKDVKSVGLVTKWIRHVFD